MEEEIDKLWGAVLREHPVEERTLGKQTFSWVSSSCLLPSSFMALGASWLQVPHASSHMGTGMTAMNPDWNNRVIPAISHPQ